MNNEVKYLEPFKTIQEVEQAVYGLDDWTKPGELYKYLEILYRLTAFYGEYEIDMDYDGLMGRFVGFYSSHVLTAVHDICKTKFPSYEIWDEHNRLRPGVPKSVNYLGNYMTGGMSVIVERSDFKYKFEETFGCRLKKQTKDDIMSIEATSYAYMEKKINKR